MDFPRAVDFDEGVAMVVTDLHGCGDAFDRVVDTFERLRRDGQAQRLIICGDLIHGYGDEAEDDSLPMLIQVEQMQAAMGEDSVVLLLGNHEMPHIYGVTLSKGEMEYTPRFERALTQSGKRDELLAFLRGLPFVVRTKAGVTLTHAGATVALKTAEDAGRLLSFDHDALLHLADDTLRNRMDLASLKQDERYVNMSRYYLAVDGPDDPRLPEFLRGQIISQLEAEFQFLWDVLFARNEGQWGDIYASVIVPAFLKAISSVSTHEQRVVVSGHIGVRGGHRLLGTQNLRLATYAHANPCEAGEYLLLDCASAVQDATQLKPQLHKLFA